MYAIAFPAIDPIAIELGPLVIRWYSLAYVLGILLGWRYALRLADRTEGAVSREHIDDFVVWATLGIVLGGRLGYVLFYRPDFYFANPLEILFFGRIANFINGELFGRVTDVPWAMVFPRGGPEPRHPSQLYESALEGLVLFVVIAVLIYRFNALKKPGLVIGTFFAGYGIARIVVEFFRQPDAGLGFVVGFATMGQLLSLPLLLFGLWLIHRALRRG